jgi:hypothetical protein
MISGTEKFTEPPEKGSKFGLEVFKIKQHLGRFWKAQMSRDCLSLIPTFSACFSQAAAIGQPDWLTFKKFI